MSAAAVQQAPSAPSAPSNPSDPSAPSAPSVSASARVVVDLEANNAPSGDAAAAAASAGSNNHGSTTVGSSRRVPSAHRSSRRSTRRSLRAIHIWSGDALGLLLGLTTVVSDYITILLYY